MKSNKNKTQINIIKTHTQTHTDLNNTKLHKKTIFKNVKQQQATLNTNKNKQATHNT